MARINIEDSLFKEKAFEKLMFKLGSRRAALGALIEAFMLAQKHFLSTVNDRLIPLEEWDREEIASELLDCGFAEKRQTGIYVRGSKDQFGWLAQRSNAGKASAEKKSSKKVKESTTVNDRSTTVNDSQPLTLPLSLSLPLSLTHTLTQKNITKAHKGPPKTKDTWDAYNQAYQARWKTEPQDNAKVRGQLSQLIDRVGTENAPKLARFFITLNDLKYAKAMHPSGMLLQECETLMTRMKTGTTVTERTRAQQITDSNMDLIEKIKRGEA